MNVILLCLLVIIIGNDIHRPYSSFIKKYEITYSLCLAGPYCMENIKIFKKRMKLLNGL